MEVAGFLGLRRVFCCTRRTIAVEALTWLAGRGLLSLNDLEALKAVRLTSGKPLEFIVAVPGRRYTEFIERL